MQYTKSMLMWLIAVFVVSIICLAQGVLIDWSSRRIFNDDNSAESLFQELKTIKKEAEDDLARFRNYRALYSNRITGSLDPKNDMFPAGDVISPLANTIENIHRIAVKLIDDRIETLEKCEKSVERAQNRVTRERKRGLCQKLAKKYRTDCQEILIKRNSDLYEESKVFLDLHEIRLDQKISDMIREIKLSLLRIDQTIEYKFSKKLQEFEDSYKTPLPWNVKLDCLEEASTVNQNMSAEAKLFANQAVQEVKDCRYFSTTNSTLFECLWKSKEKVEQRLAEIKTAVDINLGPPFTIAKECARNYLGDNRTLNGDILVTLRENTLSTLLFNWL